MKQTMQATNVLDFIESYDLQYGEILIKHLKEFTQREFMTFEELDAVFLENFKVFLNSRYTTSYCGTFRYLRFLRKICISALDLGITDTNPFETYIILPYQKPKPHYTPYQLQKLRQVRHLIKPSVCRVFYFVLFTGMSLRNFRKLTVLQAKNMKLKKDAKKLLDTMVSDRINDDEPLFKGLPHSDKLSSTFRLWGALAGLSQKPTLLCARNTFILNQLKNSTDFKKTAKELSIRPFEYKPIFDTLSSLSTDKPSNTLV